MKFTFAVLFLATLLAVSACSKDKKEIPERIRMDFDGAKVNFDEGMGDLTRAGQFNILEIYGNSDDLSQMLRITIYSEDVLTAGVYKYDMNSSGLNAQASFTDGANAAPFLGYHFPTTNPMTVNITKFENNVITGTFQGELRRDGVSKNVTNGSFNLRYD